jgi:dGTP triphosphohydrolase
MLTNYHEIVEGLESNLAPYAMKSFDSPYFIDGCDLFKYYTDLWKKDAENFKLNNRTPIQHQRDRILYSNGIRKQSERYHILYGGGQRIIRNYITHTMRMMQVARTICRALKLNEDFAEAMVLGSKVGALPFIHASKNTVSNWVKEKITMLDADEDRLMPGEQKSIGLIKNTHLPGYPDWIRKIRNPRVKTEVDKHIPYAIGMEVDDAYSSGKQGYWLLTTNPYTNQSQNNSFTPELMYGIWRHSIDSPLGPDSFTHKQKVDKASSEYHSIDWKNISYESIVVQYADDITWVIENLNDANTAALMNNSKSKSYFLDLLDQSNYESTLLIKGLSKSDSGKIYSYFITDFINYSKEVLEKRDGQENKLLLQAGDKHAVIGLSAEGKEVLESFKNFLSERVFNEIKVLNRKRMLATITEGCIDLLYKDTEHLNKYLETKANIEGWNEDQKKLSIELLNNNIHRVQAVVNIFSEKSDQDIFSYVGMESL